MMFVPLLPLSPFLYTATPVCLPAVLFTFLPSVRALRPGRDFLAYHSDDDAVAQAFLLLPPLCLSRLSRAVAARGTVADHNIGLLCSPGVTALWLRGSFTDQACFA